MYFTTQVAILSAEHWEHPLRWTEREQENREEQMDREWEKGRERQREAFEK